MSCAEYRYLINYLVKIPELCMIDTKTQVSFFIRRAIPMFDHPSKSAVTHVVHALPSHGCEKAMYNIDIDHGDPIIIFHICLICKSGLGQISAYHSFHDRLRDRKDVQQPAHSHLELRPVNLGLTGPEEPLVVLRGRLQSMGGLYLKVSNCR